jgi:hypothetical protein
MCNQKNHYFINCKNEKTKRLKKLNMNQVFINSILYINHHEMLKKNKFLMNTSNYQEKTRSSLHKDFYIYEIYNTKKSEDDNKDTYEYQC